MNRFALAVIALIPLCATSALADEHAEPLAPVAHDLGFAYAYLGPDDEVSLVGHGLSIIVRPGDPYFTVNDRVVPVEGAAPRYQGGDLFVSSAFAHQLTSIERSAAASMRPARPDAMTQSAAHINVPSAGAPAQNVTSVMMGPVPGSDDIAVSGRATPGSLVSIVLKASADPLLPVAYINRSFTVAGPTGQFLKKISPAPDYFTGSVFIAEAAAVDDQTPMTAQYTPPGK